MNNLTLKNNNNGDIMGKRRLERERAKNSRKERREKKIERDAIGRPGYGPTEGRPITNVTTTSLLSMTRRGRKKKEN